MRFKSRGFKIIHDVNNLRQFLLKAQKSLGVEIDFYLLGFQTFYRKKGENQYKPVHDVRLFSKNSNFIANLDIKQTYSVEICKKAQMPKRTFGFKLFPAKDTMLRAVLLCNADLKYHDSIKEEMRQELYKTMALEGYLLGIREYQKLNAQLSAFVDALKQGKIIPKLTLNIGIGVASVAGKDGILKTFCKMQAQEDQTLNGDSAFVPKVCVQAVRKGDELFTYVKPFFGNVGRNLKGEFITTPQVKANAIKVDSTICVKEDATSMNYQAAKDGFLKEIEPNYFVISDTLEIAATLKENQQEEEEQFDIEQQSVSKAQRDIVFIRLHKDTIKTHTAMINVLEKGKVEARVVFINSALGGTIIADYIYIKNVHSYNEIYPRYSLVVDNILGEHNTFELNPQKFAFTRRDRIDYVMLSDQIKIRLRHLKKRMDEVYAYLLASQGKAHKIQYDMEKKPDEKLPKSLQCILEQYQKALEQYKNLLIEYNEIINLYYTNQVRLKNIDEGALLAKMIIRGRISEAETIVKFKVYASKHEETLKTMLSQKTPARFFEVVKEGDFFRLRSYQYFEPEFTDWIEELESKRS